MFQAALIISGLKLIRFYLSRKKSVVMQYLYLSKNRIWYYQTEQKKSYDNNNSG